MGIPLEVAKFVQSLLPEDCKEQAHWFANQFKLTMHQWDEQVDAYKAAEKAKKRFIKQVMKTHPHVSTPGRLKSMRLGLLDDGPKTGMSLDEITDEMIVDAILGSAKLAQGTNFKERDTLYNQYSQIKQQQQTAFNQLRQVLSPIRSNMKLICNWAQEAGVDLSKRKTAEIRQGNKKVKVPFTLAIAEKLAGDHFGIQQGTVFMKFPNGWYWLDREVNYCSIEAQMMQHCGRATNNASTLWSLRNENGMPAVTAEIKTTRDGRTIFQMKGKQNENPDKKYWPYIFELLNHPDFKLHVYAATGTYGGDLEWDMIPEEMQEKIKASNVDTFEEKTAEELRAETDEGREEQLNDGMQQAVNDVEFEHMSADYNVEMQDTGDDEFPTDFNISATITFGFDIYGILLPSIRTQQQIFISSLISHLESTVELPGSGWDNDWTNLAINDGRYRNNFEVSISEYEELYDEHSFKELLEMYQSWEQENWDTMIKEVTKFAIVTGHMDHEILQRHHEDHPVLVGISNELGDEYNINLSGTEIEAVKVIGVSLKEPVQIPDRVFYAEFSERVREAHGQGLEEEDFMDTTIGIDVTAKRGSTKVHATFSIKLDTDYGQDDDYVESIKFAHWVTENEQEIRSLLAELTQKHTTNPYTIDSYASDTAHLQEALDHHNLNQGLRIKYYERIEGHIVFEPQKQRYNSNSFWQLLDLVYGPDEAKEYPGYEAMTKEKYWFSLALPGKVQDHTIGEWGKLIQSAMDDYELVQRYAIKKYGKEAGQRYHLSNLHDKIFAPKEATVAEHAIRQLVRVSVASLHQTHP